VKKTPIPPAKIVASANGKSFPRIVAASSAIVTVPKNPIRESNRIVKRIDANAIGTMYGERFSIWDAYQTASNSAKVINTNASN
jgi:hypothetical protein